MGVEGGGGGYASSDTFIGKGLEKSILLSEVGWARTRTRLQGQGQREGRDWEERAVHIWAFERFRRILRGDFSSVFHVKVLPG